MSDAKKEARQIKVAEVFSAMCSHEGYGKVCPDCREQMQVVVNGLTPILIEMNTEARTDGGAVALKAAKGALSGVEGLHEPTMEVVLDLMDGFIEVLKEAETA